MQSPPPRRANACSFPAPFAALLFVLAASTALVAASPARAHGPTVEISESGMKPVLLNLFVGTTVHFSTTLNSPDGVVVVDQTGALESPPLKAPGDGWHYTFDKTGTFEIHVAQRPAAKMRIVVVPKAAP